MRIHKHLRSIVSASVSELSGNTFQTNPDLALIIDAWTLLPRAFQAAMGAMAKASLPQTPDDDRALGMEAKK